MTPPSRVISGPLGTKKIRSGSPLNVSVNVTTPLKSPTAVNVCCPADATTSELPFRVKVIWVQAPPIGPGVRRGARVACGQPDDDVAGFAAATCSISQAVAFSRWWRIAASAVAGRPVSIAFSKSACWVASARALA
jgi:hypothetical protein